MIPGKRVKLNVFGRVQGVGFRFSVREQALIMGLTGWVINCPDGTVEIIAEGDEKTLKDLIFWCYNGVKGSRIDDIKTSWSEATGEFEDFNISHLE